MIGRRVTRCQKHRAALLDFVDRRETGPSTDQALDHLDRCHDCEVQLIDIALAITALRRLQVEARAVEPGQDAWVRIRASITRRPVALWRSRMTLGGLIVSATLVGVLAGPVAIDDERHGAPIRETLIETVAPGAATFDPAESRLETAFIVVARRTASRDASDSAAGDAARGGPSRPVISRIYADGIRVVGEEVAISEANGRPPGVS